MDLENMIGMTYQVKTADELSNRVLNVRHGQIDNQTLRAVMNRLFPGQNIVPNDKDMDTRTNLANAFQRQLKHLLQDNFNVQQKRAALGLKQPRGGFDRVLTTDTLFGLDTRDMSMEEYTRRHNILAGNDKAAKTALVMEQFHRVKQDIQKKGFTLDSLPNMSDPEIVLDFEDIQKTMSWAGAVDGLLKSKELSLSEEQKKELTDFQDEYVTATHAFNRARFIASPYYGAVQLENMPLLQTGGNYDYFDSTNTVFPEDSDEPGIEESMIAFRDMRQHIMRAQNSRGSVLRSGVERQLEGVPCNEIKWIDDQGKTIPPECSYRGNNTTPSYSPPTEGMREGKSLTAILPNGTKKTFQPDIAIGGGMKVRTDVQPAMIPDTDHKLPLSQYMDRHIKSSLTDLSTALDKADPFFVRSSQQFKDMKSTLEKVRKEWRPMNGVAHPHEMQRLQEQMESLKAASEAYLAIKQDKESFSDRELARFNAVNEINIFATQQLANIRTLNNRQPHTENEAERQAFKDARSQEAIDARQAGMPQQKRDAKRFAHAGERTTEILRDRTDPKKEAELYLQRFWKAAEYQSIPCPPSGPNKDNYAMKHLRDTAVCALEPLFTAATFSKIPPANMDKVQRNMAAITLFHMVMTERGAHFNGKAGPLEQALTNPGEEKLINSIKNMQQFKDIVGKVTPDRLHDFIMQDGGRQIGKQIVEAIRDQNRAAQNPEPQRAAQKEKHNSMGM